MARTIDADVLKKAILAEPWKNEPNAVRLTVDYINIIIDEQPTVDAVPVVHGRWVNAAGGRTICNNCGNYPLYDYFGRQKFSAHCPNCGVKMDLGVE